MNHYGDEDWQATHLLAVMKRLKGFQGERFLAALTISLTARLQMRHAFISEVLPDHAQLQALFFADRQDMKQPFIYPRISAPCQYVVEGKTVAIPCDLSKHFSADGSLQSYVGVPLYDHRQQVIGLLAMLDENILVGEQRIILLLELLSSHAGTELELVRLRNRLKTTDRQ